MKNLIFAIVTLFTIAFGVSSCSKEKLLDPTDTCVINPINGQPLCGVWKNTTNSDTLKTEDWIIDSTFLTIRISRDGATNTSLSVPFYIGSDTTFNRLDYYQNVGSDSVVYKMSNSLDTLILTPTKTTGTIQKLFKY